MVGRLVPGVDQPEPLGSLLNAGCSLPEVGTGRRHKKPDAADAQ